MKMDVLKTCTSRISRTQSADTGMAMVLICLLAYAYTHKSTILVISIILLVINMVWPLCFRPVAVIWLGIATLLGTIVSKIILTLIFYLIVTPIGLMRKAAGADPMKLKQWKKDASSVFTFRNHTYRSEDMERPY